jgi:hypothetical protein
LGLRVSVFEFQVTGFGFRASSSGFEIPGFRFRFPGACSRVSSQGLGVQTGGIRPIGSPLGRCFAIRLPHKGKYVM